MIILIYWSKERKKKTSENLFLQALTFIAVLWLMDWNKYAKKVSRIKKIK